MTAGRRSFPILAAVLLLVLTSCGRDDEGSPAVSQPAASVDQTVDITMVEFAFRPDTITVKAGTTVRFRFHNDGTLVHDATFGDDATQKAVEDGKAKRDGPEVGPNKTQEVVRTFGQPGQLIIGCHQPGHYQQGMLARLNVS